MSTFTAPQSTTTTGWLRDAATLTGRVLRHWKRRPGSLVVSLLFPVLMVLMFGYRSGGHEGVGTVMITNGSRVRPASAPSPACHFTTRPTS